MPRFAPPLTLALALAAISLASACGSNDESDAADAAGAAGTGGGGVAGAEGHAHADGSTSAGGAGSSGAASGGSSGGGTAGAAGADGSGGDGGRGGSATAEPAGAFVAVGYGGRRLRTVDDGVTWGDDASLTPMGGDDDKLLRTAVVGGPRHLVALGWRVMTSPDGASWTDNGATIGQWIGAAAYGAGRLVAVGGYGLRATSDDGLTWAQHGIDGDTTATHSHEGLAYGGARAGLFVAANDNGQRSYSVDGTAWVFATGAEAIKTTAVAYGAGAFVAIGDGGMAVSHDGMTWAAAGVLGTAAGGFVFADDRFVVLGTDHVYTSTDGVTWQDHAVEGMRPGSLAHGHGTYVVVRGTQAQTSRDAVTWSGAVSLGGTNSLEKVIFVTPSPTE